MSDVATGIFGSSAALAIVPAGSTNIAARSLGIPAEPAAALALLWGLNGFAQSTSAGAKIAHLSTSPVLALTRRYFMRQSCLEAPPRLVCLSPRGGGGASAAAV